MLRWMLLIEPYGIEIILHFHRPAALGELLIEPYGIEMHFACLFQCCLDFF